MRSHWYVPALIVAAGCGTGSGDSDAGPRRLSQTALYRDIADKEVSSSAQEFQPRYVLWSDGADKRRWIRLPAGKSIDTSDLDHWKFPVGTQFYKEFSAGGKRLETRLIEKVADTGD